MAEALLEPRISGAVFLLSFASASEYGKFNFSFPCSSKSTLASTWEFPTTTPNQPQSSFSSLPLCRKRSRPLADIDTPERDVTKKRRLRLATFTSRLSAPSAFPPRSPIERGAGNHPGRLVVWAKPRMFPAHQFRKMAILNRIRREAMALQEAQRRQNELIRQQNLERLLATPPRRTSKRIQSKKSEQTAATIVAAVAAANNGMKRAAAAAAALRSSNSSALKTALTAQQQQSSKVVKSKPAREYRKIAPNPPKPTPLHKRPPTPPSEEELEKQRKLRRSKRQMTSEISSS